MWRCNIFKSPTKFLFMKSDIAWTMLQASTVKMTGVSRGTACRQGVKAQKTDKIHWYDKSQVQASQDSEGRLYIRRLRNGLGIHGACSIL